MKSFFDMLGFSHIWENQNTFSIRSLKKAISEKLRDRYIKFWKDSLNENNPEYTTKLKTYKLLKTNYTLENYLLLDIDKTHISNYTKIRISNSKLRIEEGRHKKIALNDRICPLCNTGIEDEIHFVIYCNKLKDLRLKLYSKLDTIFPDFHNLNEDLKFKLIMSNNEADVNTIVILGISAMYTERQDMLTI